MDGLNEDCLGVKSHNNCGCLKSSHRSFPLKNYVHRITPVLVSLFNKGDSLLKGDSNAGILLCIWLKF